jgi:uncharacterized protein (DUF2141 family)
MKRLLLPGIILIIFSKFSFSQNTLKIEITEIRNNEGNIMLQIFDENEEVLISEIGRIKDKKCLFTIKNLKDGKYAVRYYHDENLNGQMETNMLGKPSEGYGFSNNVTGTFGPPPFNKWLFEINGDKKIVLKPNY